MQVLVEWVEWVVEPELMVLVELELDRMEQELGMKAEQEPESDKQLFCHNIRICSSPIFERFLLTGCAWQDNCEAQPTAPVCFLQKSDTLGWV